MSTESDDLGPEIANFDDLSGGPVVLLSYHYDALMRLRKIRLREEGRSDFWLAPMVFPDGTPGLRREEI